MWYSTKHNFRTNTICLICERLKKCFKHIRSNNVYICLKFSIKDFFNKCDLIRGKRWIWSHLLKKSLTENFIYCAVTPTYFLHTKVLDINFNSKSKARKYQPWFISDKLSINIKKKQNTRFSINLFKKKTSRFFHQD